MRSIAIKRRPLRADDHLRPMDDGVTPNARSELERRFQNLVENIPGLVVYLDVVQPDDPGCSLPLWIAPQVEQLLGYPREAWLTEDELWLDVLHPEDRERMIAMDTEARRALTPLFAEYRMIARDGRVVWVSEKATVVRDELTGTLYWQGVMVDISDRKLAEEALAASERQYRSVFDAATFGLMTLDLGGRVLESNSVVEHVLAYPLGSLVGLSLIVDLEAGDEAQRRIESLASGNEDRFELEHRLRAHDDSWIWCRTVMVVVRDGAGRPEHLTAMVENIDGRKQAEAELVHRTIHDSLTKLPNRQHFLERLAEARADVPVRGLAVGVVFVDLDNFKDVNDALGHDTGDKVLEAVAERLLAAVRPGDLVARFGGDEFLVLVEQLDDARDATRLAWRLAHSLRMPFSIAGTEIGLTASFGVATSSDPEEASEDLVRKADAAMYAAKQRGSNRVAVFGELDDADTALSA